MKKLQGFANEYLFVLPKEVLNEFNYSTIIKDLFLTDLGFYPKAKYHYVHRPTGTDEWIMIFCLNGEGTVESANRQWTVSRGSIMLMPPNKEHTYYASKNHPWDIFWVHFSGRLVGEYLSPLFHEGTDFKLLNEDSEKSINFLMSIFWQMIQTLKSGFSYESVFYDSQLLGTLLAYVVLHSKLPKDNRSMGNEYLTKAIQYIYDNLDKHITLADLTDSLGVSASYLSRIFKNNMNMGVNQFITSIKLKQAAHYLQNTNISIQEIALGLGYSDPYYFSRAFKKSNKLSPAKFRKEYGSNISRNDKEG